MYIVTIDGNFIFGTGKYERPGYELISPQAEFAVNTAGTFMFTMYPQHPCYDLVDNTKSIVQIKKDGEKEPFFRGRVLSTEMGFYNEKKVVCEGELAFLCDTIQQNYDYSSGSSRKTIYGLLLHFLTVHNEKIGMDNTRSFKIGRVNVTDSDTTNTDNLISAADSTFLNTYDSIQQKLIERYGGYLYVRHENDGNYIDYLSSPQETCRQSIEFGGNLLNIKKNIEADSLVTAVIPLGKEREDGGEGGSGNRHNISGWDISRSVTDADDILQVTGKVGTTKTYLNCMYSQSAVEKYGWIEKVLIFDDVVLPATLARYGEAHLKSAGKALTIELNAADLSGANTEIDRFKIGQYVRVNSKPHNLENELYVVSKLSINLSNPAANKICIGTETATITGQVSGANGSTLGIGVVGGGFGYDESGSANNALQKAKDYADLKDTVVLEKAKNYVDSKANYQGENGVKVEGLKISLAHNISAGTVGESTSTTLNFGASFPVPWIKYNANGQIEQVGNRTIFMPPNPTDNNFTDAEKTKLAGIDANANNYVHPKYTSRSSGVYKFQVNSTGHISGAVKAEKSDFTALGIAAIEDIACYGTCITDGGNPTKSVTLDGFKLAVGKKITVIFSNANTADGITINVNGTGAKPVYYVGSAMTYRLLKIPAQTGIDFIYDGTSWVYCGQESYVSQTNATDNANYRLLLSYTDDNAQDRASVKKSSKFTANPSTGILSARYFKQSQSGTLLAENSTNENSLTVTNAEIVKYSQLYMAASWAERETVNFCDIIPISAIVAGAVFTKQVYTGTRTYTYTVSCTNSGEFTLTQSNSTGTQGTLRLKLYVI